MKRQFLPIEALRAWAKLNGITFHDVEIKQLRTDDGIDKGSAVVTTCVKVAMEDSPDPEVLMVVPRDLVLSLDLVHTCAKSDRYLKEVLEAVGDFGKQARGAILIFLLLLITHSQSSQGEGEYHVKEHVGISNPWSEYIKFLPESFSLPTFFTSEELELLHGTSLKPALNAKMNSLLREFDRLREATKGLPWCDRHWWSEETGQLTFNDWLIVDAMFRSRALDLPGTGHAMVPCVDMANHASGDGTGALYETDADGNAVLQLRWGQRLEAGEEVTITYGDEKGASEMIFSYGFLEGNVEDARQLFLDLDIPDDDPLKPAKRAICDDAPGVRLYSEPNSSKVNWESNFVWWACVNEEDGLAFRVLQSTDGERELKVFWKEKELSSSKQLIDELKSGPMWDVFQLRATLIIQERIETQLSMLQESQTSLGEWDTEKIDGQKVRQSVYDMIMKLRELEWHFLIRASQNLEDKKADLLESERVKAYLGIHAPGAEISEDFS
ncbi:hypothetical protein VTO42DRAFT_7754 [Malbranchea cinnamomea]